jgi:molybdate/tungstate transport system substrate-binding protein
MLRRAFLPGALLLAFPVLSHAAPAGTVSVLYAGSLVNLMEHGIGPAFGEAAGGTFRGFAGGSNALANQIKGKLRQGDVFISANPKVNDDLTGAPNGNWVSWYAVFARSPLVIGYNPASRFAADFKAKPWYEVLRAPGIRIGRTDPKLDPKGRLTVQLLRKAEDTYKQPGLAAAVLGKPDNPAQVLPEENLVGEMQSGQLDAGFFYSTETSDLHIASIPLPPEVALGARYTVTILRDAPNPDGAERFVAFLLGPDGRRIMQAHGLDLVKPKVTGDAAAVPAGARVALDLAK